MMIREVRGKRGRGDEGVGKNCNRGVKTLFIWEGKSRIISERG